MYFGEYGTVWEDFLKTVPNLISAGATVATAVIAAKGQKEAVEAQAEAQMEKFRAEQEAITQQQKQAMKALKLQYLMKTQEQEAALIPGVSNTILLVGAGGIALLWLLRR